MKEIENNQNKKEDIFNIKIKKISNELSKKNIEIENNKKQLNKLISD